MTCHQALSLLDDYIDNELSPAVTAEVAQHLEQCAACRQEYESGKHLTQVLKQTQDESRLPDPGEDYWSEVSSLILARTVESSAPSADEESPVRLRSRAETRQSLMRSAMLFAASLVLLLGALLVGSQRGHFGPSAQRQQTHLIMTASLSDAMASDHEAIVTKEEETALLRGMLALGAPGPVGRYGGLTELLGAR